MYYDLLGCVGHDRLLDATALLYLMWTRGACVYDFADTSFSTVTHVFVALPPQRAKARQSRSRAVGGTAVSARSSSVGAVERSGSRSPRANGIVPRNLWMYRV